MSSQQGEDFKLPYQMSEAAAAFLSEDTRHWWEYYVVAKKEFPEYKEGIISLKKKLANNALGHYYKEIEPALTRLYKSDDEALEIVIRAHSKEVFCNMVKDASTIIYPK